ncbi:hypothetical protein [Azospirillum argentinense]|uniref:hypothetical protein n=1 Tax=Azospirillum argentinense TaxID=2970906 RepID=UPI0032DF173D
MAIRALSLTSTRRYESKYDPARGTPDATVFVIGTLDSRIYGRLRDLATRVNVDRNRPDDEVSTSVNLAEVAYETVAYGLRGIERFVDDAGDEVRFRTKRRYHGGQHYDAVDDEVLKQLPQQVISELAEEIGRDNELTEAEAKN